MPPDPRSTRLRRRVTSFTVGVIAMTATAGAVAAATLHSADDAEYQAQPETTSQPPVQPPVALAESEPEQAEPPFDYGTCPPVARACVDLDGQRAWLQENGEITHGAFPIGQGGPGYETPRASFHVSRKVEYDVSYVFDMAPMPYAVYFTDVGHAFHEGDPEGDSHGCVRLAPGVAEIYFHELQTGDMVHIY